MTENLKPTSKVIQITASRCPDGIPVLYALCEDGSVWEKYQGKWNNQTEELLEADNAK